MARARRWGVCVGGGDASSMTRARSCASDSCRQAHEAIVAQVGDILIRLAIVAQVGDLLLPRLVTY